jgi:carbamoyltransferase
MSLNIIGISSHFHDSACCILRDGKLVAAAQEERFTRRKHDPSIPWNAFRFCLQQANLDVSDISCLGYFEDPVKKLGRQIWMGLPEFPPTRPDALHQLDASRPEREIREILGYEGPIHYFDHHQSHAAASYFFSGFKESAIFTVDAVGEWTTMSFGRANGTDIELFKEISFPHSIGLLYSTLTSYLGFEVNEGEYKLMGLAAYGRPRYTNQLRQLFTEDSNGDFKLELEYFDFVHRNRMFSDRLFQLIGRGPRRPDADDDPFWADLASSIQVLLEESLLKKVNYLHSIVPSRNLCMAGGVALNVVANAKISREGPFENIFVQPAAGDAGSALGAAALAHVKEAGTWTADEPLRHLYWGPAFEADEIAELFAAGPLWPRRYEEPELLKLTAERLAAGAVVGWFQGPMEFGPRALGSRSILADPRRPDMKGRINKVVKRREAFRPFGPSVLLEETPNYFDLHRASPFMLETCRVHNPEQLPAITHVDGSARVQTVDSYGHPRYRKLLEAFHELTGCPILLNTSFNLRNEPIVCTPLDALTCFLRSEMDCLAIADFFISRSQVPSSWIDRVRESEVPATHAVNYDIYSLL